MLARNSISVLTTCMALTVAVILLGCSASAFAESADSEEGATPPASSSSTVEPLASSDSSTSSSSSAPATSRTSKPLGETPVDPRSFDANGNPTLFAICELDGSELQSALQAKDYTWIESAKAWMAPSGSVLEARDMGRLLTQAGIDMLGEGVSDDAAAYTVVAAGYATPSASLDGLSEGVVTVDRFEDPDGAFAVAIVHGTNLDKTLVVATQTAANRQTLLVFGEGAIQANLFSEMAGINVERSLPAIWNTLVN